MNRRNFLRLAVAAALAPVAFTREPEFTSIYVPPPVYGNVSRAEYTWWRNDPDTGIFRTGADELGFAVRGEQVDFDEMKRLFEDCLNYPAPDLIQVDQGIFEIVKRHRPELFA